MNRWSTLTFFFLDQNCGNGQAYDQVYSSRRPESQTNTSSWFHSELGCLFGMTVVLAHQAKKLMVACRLGPSLLMPNKRVVFRSKRAAGPFVTVLALGWDEQVVICSIKPNLFYSNLTHLQVCETSPQRSWIA